MRKYIVLLGALLMVLSSFYIMYKINQPVVGAIGNGTIAPMVWVTLIFTAIGGVFLLVFGMLLFLKENKQKINREIKR